MDETLALPSEKAAEIAKVRTSGVISIVYLIDKLGGGVENWLIHHMMPTRIGTK